MPRTIVILLITLCLVSSANVRADSVVFTGADTDGRSASVDFTQLSGNQLQVTLTNTSTNDVLVPVDVLTGVFFDILSNPTLSRISAILADGSTILFPPSGTGTDVGNSVGGEWAYRNYLSGAPGGARQGISSSGLGLVGPGDRFPGSNLQGPGSPGGLDYGLTSAGDNPATGNRPVTGKSALARNSVVFRLGNLPDAFQVGDISNVQFQYGTSLSEPHFAGFPSFNSPNEDLAAPEPSALLLFTLGGLMLCYYQRRRKNSTSRD